MQRKVNGRYDNFHYGVHNSDMTSTSLLRDVIKSKCHSPYNDFAKDQVFGVKMDNEEVLYTKTQSRIITLCKCISISAIKEHEIRTITSVKRA